MIPHALKVLSAELGDDPRSLVTEHDGEAGRELAVDDRQIAVAAAAVLHVDAHLAVAGPGDVDVGEGQGLALGREQCGAHGWISSLARERPGDGARGADGTVDDDCPRFTPSWAIARHSASASSMRPVVRTPRADAWTRAFRTPSGSSAPNAST